MDSEIEGGIYVDKIPVGHFLEVETKNHLYTIEHKADGFYISGHPKFCPEPRRANIHGSTWGGSMLKEKFIGRKMRLEFSLPDNPEIKSPITTSLIQEIKEFKGE